jgi:PAS domain S-box-containing protein
MNKDHLLRILFVEDRPEDAEIAIRELKRENLEFEHRIVQTEKDFIQALRNFAPTLIVSDYSMPEFDGMRALKIAKSYTKQTPFIILTGSINEETAVACMKEGADDYVLKEQIKRLSFAVKDALEKNRSFLENLKMANQLKESEAKYRSYIDNSPNGVFVIDPDGYFLDVNPMLSSLTGYSIDQLLTMNITDLFMNNETIDYVKNKFSELRDTGKTSFQMQYRKKDMSACWWQINVVMINPKKALAFATDISEQKRAEVKLKEALEKAKESDRLKSAFLANMSHEIRTPMNGILGFSNLLKQHDVDLEKRQEYIDIIQQSGKRMLNTINDLINISRIESGQVEVRNSYMNLNDKMNELFQFFKLEAEQKSLELSFTMELDKEKARVFTDAEKVHAILSNFINNAIKFTEKGSIKFGYRIVKDQIEFFVSDTGRGIGHEHFDKIFDRFVQADQSLTRAYEGSGLGLSISKAYAGLLHGRIRVESEPNQGSTFYLYIPYTLEHLPDKEKSIDKPEKKSKDDDFSDINVLIAEDDEASIIYLEALLGEKFKTVYFSTNGKDVIQKIKEHPEIDLILMDVKMPILDGLSATREIRKFNRDIKIIAQTAYAMESDNAHAVEAGCDGYISKPLNEEDLFKLIARLFK